MGKITQDEYIAILFDDLGFSGQQRRDWLHKRYGKRYMDELTVGQKSFIIDDLKSRKPEREVYDDRDDKEGG